MEHWVVGLSTGCFYKHPILEVLEPISENRFSMLEICSHPAHLDYRDQHMVRKAGALIKSLDLIPFSFHAPFHQALDITALDPQQRERSINEIIKSMEAAAALEAMNLVLHPGPDKEGRLGPEEYRQRMHNGIHAIGRICEACSQHRIGLVLENLLPHLILGQTEDVVEMVQQNFPVSTCLDTGHAHLCGGVSKALKMVGPNLKMIHAHDNLGETDDHLPPGQGNIDWPALMRDLKEVRFQGPIILELGGGHDAIQKPLTQARRARVSLRQWMEHQP